MSSTTIYHMLTHGLFYMTIATGYLFIFMRTASPRIWGYSDYPAAIKKKIPPQTEREKIIATIVGVPWLLFILGFPIVSTYLLKTTLGNDIPFWVAFLNLVVLILLFTVGDLLILDWLVISKLTPKFVIIPGTVKEDYKDFSHHYKAHARAAVVLILICLVVAGTVSYL
jgi:hypothetical protein